jgi:CDP-glycerol glycerophosphotransferase
VIVPVHRVQGYLQQCLESLLGDTESSRLEVIAVDDASPDHCGEILDEYAQRDQRLRVRHLTENVGLGEARNIGLTMATGDYVWFFDSDDHATEGAVEAILKRLDHTRPDVLLFDYARSYWTGKVARNILNDQFRVPPAPDVFTLAERPSVLNFLMTAWNRAIRREFLLGLGLRFSTGYYEDLNVTYPMLMAAGRISLLDRVCYVYRQRRLGAITKTVGHRHFDVFPQYERIFAWMDQAGPEVDRFRPAMFDRAMWHLLIILDKGNRVTGNEREFFGAMSAFYRTYRPKDHQLPAQRNLAHKYRLVEKDSHALYSALRKVNATTRRARRQARKAARGLHATAAFGRKRLKAVYYRVQLRMPMEPNLAVYAAYWYRGYACNPAAIYEKTRELAPQVKGVWVVHAPAPGEKISMPAGVPYVIAGTPAYYRTLARAKYFFNNVNYPDHVIKRKGQVHVMTQHGTPLKRMGLDQMAYPVSSFDTDFVKMITRSDRWDYLVSSNPLSTEAWERGFPCSYEMLEIGYPRNDRYYRSTAEEAAGLRAELGVPEGKKAILYAPTHRDYQNGFYPQFDIGAFMERIGPDYVLLLRAHYFYEAGGGDWPADQVIDVSEHPSVEDLAIASDALLTDYSSVMFDYANLDGRPIVIYANDWETYLRTRGVNFDLMAFPPGVVATDEEELVRAFTSGAAWGDAAAKHRAAFRERFCPWDDGNASERLVRRVFRDVISGPASR